MRTSLKPQSQKGGRSNMINQMFQIAGDNGTDDKNLDLQFLSRVNFDEIEKLDPNGREGYVTVCQVAVPTDIELDEKHD